MRFRKEELELFEGPGSGDWIELGRNAISVRTALATRPQVVPAAPAPALVASLNDATVAVSPGSPEADIAIVSELLV